MYLKKNSIVNTPCVLYIRHMGNTEKPILNLVIDPMLLEKVDEFWHENRFVSRSEAIRWLIQSALDKKLKPATNPAAENKGPKRAKHAGK
jgi:Arc/MetJ-type ribon-helix-helix transcriptional regulator